MKLTLTNFRCYRSTHVFQIVDTGITLISGHSGTGKTTLLMAIYFALTGNCPSKVISDGCDTCTVELEHEHETIVRTRRPNRLVVKTPKGQWEDDIAQAHVDRKWGKYFEITSYIQQQYQKTFLYQTPSEKLDILERLCFEESPEELKKKCAAQYKALHNQHLLLKGRYDTLSKLVRESEYTTSPSLVTVPNSGEYQSLISNRQTRKQQESQYFEAVGLESKIQEAEQQLEEFRNKLGQLQVPEYSKKNLENNLHRLRQLEELPPLQKVWEIIPKEETHNKIVTAARHIQLHKEFKVLIEKVEDLEILEGQLRRLTVAKSYFLSVYEGEYECPQCKSMVSLINDQLILSERIEDEQKTYMSPEQKKLMLEELDRQIIAHEREIGEHLPYRTRKNEIEMIIDVDMKVEDLEKESDLIEKYYQKNMTIEAQNIAQEERLQQLLSKIIPHFNQKQSLDALEIYNTHESTTQQVQYFERHLKSLIQKRTLKSPINLKMLQMELEDIEQRIQLYNTQKHAYEMYQIQMQQHQKYLKDAHDLQTVEIDMKKLERQMSAVTELKQIILKTESEVINQKIREISQLVNTYLQYIFTEPITVQLQTLKKTQTQHEKVQVQLEVFYKNMKCDVSILSGGEQARMNLAFILAFAHIFHAPILMLDECTSNLDAELTETVIQQIENVGIPKVIMIAHQIVEGNFKQVLNI